MSDDPAESPRPHVWPFARHRPGSAAHIHDPIVQAVALVVLASVFFLLFPAFDLWFSGLFYQPGYGFPMGRLPFFIDLRAFGNTLAWIIAIALAVALAIKLALPWRPSLVAPRDALFILGTLAIGPGLIVNLVFKNHWGRPRPVMLDVFSSAQPFVGVWHMSDACTTNCSFVSGEASSALWLVTIAVLFPPAWRTEAVKWLLILAVALSLNRIVVGGHFISDVVLAWGITLVVIALAYRLLYLDPPAALSAASLEAAMTRAGEAIHGLVARARRRT